MMHPAMHLAWSSIGKSQKVVREYMNQHFFFAPVDHCIIKQNGARRGNNPVIAKVLTELEPLQLQP